MPMLRRCTGTPVMSVPPTWMRPSSGVSNPAIIRNVVVLPQPDGPSSAKNSPASIARSTPSTARLIPSKLLLRRSKRTAAAARAGSLICTPRRRRSPAHQPGDARVDIVLALVVPFPVHLDELRHLGLGVVEPGVVLGSELHLAVRRRVPHRLGERLLHVGPQHEVDIGVAELLHLRAGRDGPHLLERQHALLGGGELDRLVLPVI